MTGGDASKPRGLSVAVTSPDHPARMPGPIRSNLFAASAISASPAKQALPIVPNDQD